MIIFVTKVLIAISVITAVVTVTTEVVIDIVTVTL